MRVLDLFLPVAAAYGALAASFTNSNNTSTSAHGTLTFSHSPNITRVTINNPPINLYTATLCSDLLDFLQQFNASSPSNSSLPKVVIFSSANPSFWIDHWDLTSLIAPTPPTTPSFTTNHSRVINLIRNLTNVVLIAELDGLATGVGNEILTQMDMRFAGPGARAGQIEVSAGVLPGSGGAQALPRLIGPGRALQYLLTGESVDAETGVKLGWFNEGFGSGEELRARVDDVARKIALYPIEGVAAIKRSVATTRAPQQAFVDDTEAFAGLVGLSEVQKLLKKFVQLGNNQTLSPFELGLDATLSELYE